MIMLSRVTRTKVLKQSASGRAEAEARLHAIDRKKAESLSVRASGEERSDER